MEFLLSKLIEEYKKGKLSETISSKQGIYKIKKPPTMQIRFSETLSSYKDTYCDKCLERKYEKGDRYTLYIGKAEGKKGLYQRIKQYIEQSIKGKGHMGGRAIFQIENWSELLVDIKECACPSQQEKNLLEDYYKAYKTLPLGNWKRG